MLNTGWLSCHSVSFFPHTYPALLLVQQDNPESTRVVMIKSYQIMENVHVFLLCLRRILIMTTKASLTTISSN